MNTLKEIGTFFLVLFLCGCTPKVYYTYCDEFTNKDSLINCILTQYDDDAFFALLCCHTDCNMDLYKFLLSDSNDCCATFSIPTYNPDGSSSYGLSDTITLFYETRGVVMGALQFFDASSQRKIEFPDSIYNILYSAYHLIFQKVKAHETYRHDLNDLDSLRNEVITRSNLAAYDKLRLLYPADSLLQVSIVFANKKHYPIACYDVYRLMTCHDCRLSDEEFKFAYHYLCEAVDSMYYPAIFIKAGLCLTGAYFPQDTILGKDLLLQCHATTSIPFWRQYLQPPVYQHLLLP